MHRNSSCLSLEQTVSDYYSLKTLTLVIDDGATNITTKDKSYKINVTNICTLSIKYMRIENLPILCIG